MSGLSTTQRALFIAKEAIIAWVVGLVPEHIRSVEWKAPSGNVPLPSLFIFPRNEGNIRYFIGMEAQWEGEIWFIIVAETFEQAQQLAGSIFALIPSDSTIFDINHPPGWHWSYKSGGMQAYYHIKNTTHLRIPLYCQLQPL